MWLNMQPHDVHVMSRLLFPLIYHGCTSGIDLRVTTGASGVCRQTVHSHNSLHLFLHVLQVSQHGPAVPDIHSYMELPFSLQMEPGSLQIMPQLGFWSFPISQALFRSVKQACQFLEQTSADHRSPVSTCRCHKLKKMGVWQRRSGTSIMESTFILSSAAGKETGKTGFHTAGLIRRKLLQ